MNKGKKFLSDLKFFESYSKWNGRKETWNESVSDVMKMHRNKFAGLDELLPYLEKVEDAYANKEILASQRNLQYREEQITRSNARLFNCSSTYIDRAEVFKEAMWVLLNGCGVGYSVERRFIEKLPTIKRRKEETITYVIEDSIEGWANALDMLMQSFFNGSEKIRFDGSLIRPEGAFISGGFKAPGYEPLKKSLELIERMLEQKLTESSYKLTSLDAHEIVCISSDAVLSAGVRRSAIICLFDKDDELMLNCKTGNWFNEKPWLARANNSIKLIRGTFTKKEFDGYKDAIKQFGEPGIVLVDDERFCTNPCVTKDTMVTTDNGTFRVEDLIGKEFNVLIDGKSYKTKSEGFWKTGNKPVYKLITKEGYELKLTNDHKLLTDSGWKELKYITPEDKINLNVHKDYHWGNQDNEEFDKAWLLGNLIGDGTFDTGGNAILRYWGKETYLAEYAKSILNEHFRKGKPFVASSDKEITSISSVGLLEFAEKYDIKPKYKTPNYLIETESSKFYSGFISGLFDADGSVMGNTKKGVSIRLSQTNLELLKIVQRMLLKLGIFSKIYLNRHAEGYRELPDGKGGLKEYYCQSCHELVISRESLQIFSNRVGFKVKHKQENLNNLLSQFTRKLYKDNQYCKLQEIIYLGNEDVYDVTVEKVHKFDANGIVAHNCGEIGFIPINPSTGNSCWSFCNLNEINGGKCDTEEKFYQACENASILGTLQASYTNLNFLGKDTIELVEQEALLGVSITGIMDNPHILLNPEILQKGAKIVNETNEKIAKIIGINPAARTTTVKPSGNASVLLQTSSGIHPAHSRKYFRIVQMNKNNEVAKVINDINPSMLEESVWSPNRTDYAIYIPIKESDLVITKDQMSDSEFMSAVDIVYNNWVLPGTNKGRGYSDYVTHNVSNTITVQDWDKTFDYIYENQKSFCGLSFMAELGDKVYKQAPFTKVMEFDELIESFGTGVLFSSGLIVDALHHFDGNLWDACDAVKNRDIKFTGDRYKIILKKDIIRRIKKFAKSYFNNDIDKTIDCLKNVHIFHKYETVNREMKLIDFFKLDMAPTYTDVSTLAGIACSGGSCDIITL